MTSVVKSLTDGLASVSSSFSYALFMTRRMTDGLIILTVLALGATDLWAQDMGGRRTMQGSQSQVVQSHNVPNGRAVPSHNVPNGHAVPSHNIPSRLGGSAPGPAPFGAAGPAPLGAAGPAPIGAAGPAPIGAGGPAPIGAGGPAPLGDASAAPFEDAGPAVQGGGGVPLPAGCVAVRGGVVCE